MALLAMIIKRKVTLSEITSGYESYFTHGTSYSDFTAECFKKYIKKTSEQRLLCYAKVSSRVAAVDEPKKDSVEKDCKFDRTNTKKIYDSKNSLK